MGTLAKSCSRNRVRIIRRPQVNQPLLIIPTVNHDGPPEGRSKTAKRTISSHMNWGLGGFLLGVMLWNMIGVWQFVDTSINNLAPVHRVSAFIQPAHATGEATFAIQRDVASRATPAMAVQAQVAPSTAPERVDPIAIAPRGLKQSGKGGIRLAGSNTTGAVSNCTALYVDPRTGMTAQRPCDPNDTTLGRPKSFQTAQNGGTTY